MSFFTKSLLLMTLGVLFGSQCEAQPSTPLAQKRGVILSDVPQKVDTKALYLFYISGYLVEACNTRPVSPRFGVYEYEQILDTLKQSGFVVISEARKQSAEIKPYAKKVTAQVRQLLKAGVPPEQITVVGASQGSWMAMLVSTYLENRRVNFVFISGCSADDGLLKLVNLHGNVLIIYEKTDIWPGTRPCSRFRDDATGLSEYKEVETNTGQRHGFLYRPMKEWVEPTIEWAQQHSSHEQSFDDESYPIRARARSLS
jgi:dienelactone hydrolase